jgi:hypothetical protein
VKNTSLQLSYRGSISFYIECGREMGDYTTNNSNTVKGKDKVVPVL